MTEHEPTESRKILIILDNLESDWAGEIIQGGNPDVAYHLFTIGVSPEQAFLQYDSSPIDLRQSVTVVNDGEASRQAEREARTIYIEVIRDFPRIASPQQRSILETLSCRGRNFWWYLGVSEKNIWNDPFIHRLYALMRLCAVCNTGFRECRLYIGDILLRETVEKYLSLKSVKRIDSFPAVSKQKKEVKAFVFAYFLQLGRELVKIILIMAGMRISGVRARKDIQEDSIGIFSAYPDWWRNPFGSDASDMFFNRVPDRLAEGATVQHYLWVMPWQSLFKKRKETMRFLRKDSVTVMERLLHTSDILFLFSPELFIRSLNAYRAGNSLPISVKGIDISRWMQESLFKSLTSPMFFQCILIDRALRRLPLQKLRILFFRLEFQPLERAILYNGQGKTKTIGFQHSALGKNFLNYVFADGELHQHWIHRNDGDSMPLPEYIITSGDLGIQYMTRAGYPDDHLAMGGAVRFSPLYDYMRKIPSRKALRERYNLVLDRKILLVAPSPLLQETECMLDDLFDAVGEKSSEFHLIIKCHPDAIKSVVYMKRIRELIKKKGASISSEVLDRSVSLNDYIAMSDAVLLSGGTVALEAMLLGSIPIIYVNEAQFSHNPMTEYPEAVIFVDGLDAMKRALASVTDDVAMNKLRPSWARPIHDMFGAASGNPEERFLSAVREQFHIPC